ncbi:MAG: zinc ABC transporter substrate-binding protein [Candidatus Hydrogenedentes bacterium]|nr:zinc ABC transporter substrate-binding protein [Candidatus Hydrogenedentota bacterium]
MRLTKPSAVHSWLLAFSILALALNASAQLRIVTTTTDLKSLAEAVGGELVTVTSLGTGKEDIHQLAAKPSYMVAANKADLWIRQGLELEIGFEPLILEGARNPDIQIGRRGHLEASIGVRVRDVPTVPVDRSLGDVHPMGDPHVQSDPLNGRIMAKNIRDRLADLDPANADTYTANLAEFYAQLDTAMFGEALVREFSGEVLWAQQQGGALDAFLKERGREAGGWLAHMAPHRGARLVTYHRSWGYFADRFGLEVIGELEPKPGIPPTARHLAQLVERMQALGCKVVLMEPYYSQKAPQLVAARTGAEVVAVGNMVGSEPAASGYIAMIDNIVKQLSQAFSEVY